MGTWAARLQKARNRARLSQAALAKGIGVTPGAVAHWEIGRNSPPPEKLAQISEFLNISLDWLITGKESSNTTGNIPTQESDSQSSLHRKIRQLSPRQCAALEPVVDSLLGIDSDAGIPHAKVGKQAG